MAHSWRGRADGAQVIVCSAEGEVRAYLPAGEELGAMGTSVIADKLEDETLQELHQRKQELLAELRQYEAVQQQGKDGSRSGRGASMLDTETRIAVRLEPSSEEHCLYLALEASHDARIKAAVVFADRLFESGESVAVHAKTPAAAISVPLRPPKDVSAELQVRVIAGGMATKTYHVFELTYQLPKFAMYVPIDARKSKPPSAGVTCVLPGAAQRVQMWIGASFNIAQPESEQRAASGVIEHAFVSLRTGRCLWIRMTAEAGGTMHVLTEDIETAAEVLQDVCAALQVRRGPECATAMRVSAIRAARVGPHTRTAAPVADCWLCACRRRRSSSWSRLLSSLRRWRTFARCFCAWTSSTRRASRRATACACASPASPHPPTHPPTHHHQGRALAPAHRASLLPLGAYVPCVSPLRLSRPRPSLPCAAYRRDGGLLQHREDARHQGGGCALAR